MGAGRAMARKVLVPWLAVLASIGLLGGVLMGTLVLAGPHIWAQAFRSDNVAYLTFFIPFYCGLLIFDLFITLLSVVFGGHANQEPEASTSMTAEKKHEAVLMSVGLVGGLIIAIFAFAAPHIWASKGIFDSFQTVLSDHLGRYNSRNHFDICDHRRLRSVPSANGLGGKGYNGLGTMVNPSSVSEYIVGSEHGEEALGNRREQGGVTCVLRKRRARF